MSQWYDRLRFLWEEEIAPSEEVPRMHREEPTGVPRPLRRATRFALMAVLATNLMGQIVGVRLVAPVDANPTYAVQCQATCDDAHKTCLDTCAGLTGITDPARATCNLACDDAHQACIKT